jgi:hypothetical protein
MGKPKKPKPPPPPSPAPTVQEAAPAEEEAVTRQRRRSGYQRTILTGALSPSTGKKTVLG